MTTGHELVNVEGLTPSTPTLLLHCSSDTYWCLLPSVAKCWPIKDSLAGTKPSPSEVRPLIIMTRRRIAHYSSAGHPASQGQI